MDVDLLVAHATSQAEVAEMQRNLPSLAVRKKLRLQASLSMAKSAEICGVSSGTISNWEHGNVHAKTLRQASQFYSWLQDQAR